jgi:hypothetical protein
MYEEIAREGNKKVEFGAAQGGGAESEDAGQNRTDGGGQESMLENFPRQRKSQ